MAVLRIYLAGPEVFLPRFGIEVFDAKKALCAARGFEGVSPMDGAVAVDGLSAYAQGISIYAANVRHMDACDAVIANMTPFRGVSMDAGTAFEMGYMAARGKPVLGYTHDTTPFGERSANYFKHGRPDLLEAYSFGAAVERFDMADNLMMVGSVDASGFQVAAVAVPAGEELTSVAGFACCLDMLAQAVAARS